MKPELKARIQDIVVSITGLTGELHSIICGPSKEDPVLETVHGQLPKIGKALKKINDAVDIDSPDFALPDNIKRNGWTNAQVLALIDKVETDPKAGISTLKNIFSGFSTSLDPHQSTDDDVAPLVFDTENNEIMSAVVSTLPAELNTLIALLAAAHR